MNIDKIVKIKIANKIENFFRIGEDICEFPNLHGFKEDDDIIVLQEKLNFVSLYILKRIFYCRHFVLFSEKK